MRDPGNEVVKTHAENGNSVFLTVSFSGYTNTLLKAGYSYQKGLGKYHEYMLKY